MNYVKRTLICLGSLLLCTPGWSQKKDLLQAVAKAVAAKPITAARTAAKPPAQLLAETRVFIGVHGRRPLACITNEAGLRIPAKQLTPAQLTEFQLGAAVARALYKARTEGTFKEDPSLRELAALVHEHPNPRRQPDTSALIKRRRELSIQQTLNELQQFLQIRGVWPRPIYNRGQDELTPAEKEEVSLFHRVQRIIKTEPQPSSYDPQVEQLRQLHQQYYLDKKIQGE